MVSSERMFLIDLRSKIEGKCSHPLLLHKFHNRFLAQPPQPALEIGVVWMPASWQLLITAASWFCTLTLLPLSYTSRKFHSLPVPLINIYKIPGYGSTRFCHINEPLRAVKSIFDNSFWFYLKKEKRKTETPLVELISAHDGDWLMIGAMQTSMLSWFL